MNKSLFLILALLAPLAEAAPTSTDARWFRYYDSKNQPVVSDRVTPEHVTHGYDELTIRMQLIRKVPAQRPLTPEEQVARLAQREAAAQRQRDDKQLLRLYSGPTDAVRARNRQVDALQVRIDFNTNLLASSRQRRAVEAQRAATFERKGQPVPADVRRNIAELDQQIATAQADIITLKAEHQKVSAEFAAIIQRLAELTGKPASLAPKATDAAAPAAKR